MKAPLRQAQGQRVVVAARGVADCASRVLTAKWVARTQEKPRAPAETKYANDFEKRHQERFKGVTFDWKDFQRDGGPFPAPNPAAQPALQIVVQPAAGEGTAKTLVDQDIRPADLTWHPNGQLLAFTADPDSRRAQVRPPRCLDGDDGGQGHAAYERRRGP